MLEKNIKDQKELLDSLKTEKITDNAEILRQLKLLIEQNAPSIPLVCEIPFVNAISCPTRIIFQESNINLQA